MKRIIVILFLLFTARSVHAQQLAQYTMYMYNNFILNPAVAGSKPCAQLKMGYRAQWMGYEGNPKTAYFGFHTPIKFRAFPNRRFKHGIGAYIDNDQYGAFSKTTFMLAYAMHIMVGSRQYLSVGLFAGIMQHATDVNKISVPDPTDPAKANIAGGTKWIYPDLSPGVFYYGKHYYFGACIKSAFGNHIKGMPSIKDRLTRHLNLTAGTRILHHKNTAFLPSINIKYTPLAPLAVDLNMIYDFKSVFDVGVSYRVRDAVCALVRWHIARRLDFGYSYDFPLTKVKTVTIQTHEVFIGFKICHTEDEPEQRDICPAYN